VFLFPTQDELETSAFEFSGDGAISFSELEAPAGNQTSSSNAPAQKVDFGVTKVSPGHNFTIASFACPAGQTVGFELKNAGSTRLDFFEDFNPSP
jgi:Ubiquitin 3 binding protein But2 C-terminal domain